MDALIYLQLQHGPVIEQDDLERLDVLRRHAQDAGYTVTQVRPVYEPDQDPDMLGPWDFARTVLLRRDVAAIYLWHTDKGTAECITREDLTISPTERIIFDN